MKNQLLFQFNLPHGDKYFVVSDDWHKAENHINSKGIKWNSMRAIAGNTDEFMRNGDILAVIH